MATSERDSVEITVTVNGTEHTDDVEPRVLLVDHVRETLGLTGTHIGCDTSSCGACTVLLDGRPVKSCTMLAVQADGRVGHDRRGPQVQRRSSTPSSRASPTSTACSAGSARRG